MLVLFSSTAGELYFQLNVLNQWCYKESRDQDLSALCQQYDYVLSSILNKYAAMSTQIMARKPK